MGIAFGREARQRQNPQPPGDRTEIRHDLICVLSPSFVIVGQDHDIATDEVSVEILPPPSGTARVAGGKHAQVSESVGILLALDNEHLLGVALKQIGQVVGDGLDPSEIPNPSAMSIRTPLSEALGFVPNDLKESLTVGSDVIVGSVDDWSIGGFSDLTRPCEVDAPCRERIQDGLLTATGMAMHKHLSVVAKRDGEARPMVFMGGT
jgi:hypothetical protein